MMDLFTTDRHEQLIKIPWNDTRVQTYSQYIIDQTISHYSTDKYWPAHTLDSEEIPTSGFIDFYYGAGGIYWFLDKFNNLHDFNTKKEFLTSLSSIKFDKENNISFFFDHIAFLLFRERIDPAQDNRDLLFKLLEECNPNDKNEILYGTPSTLLVAYNAFKITGEDRFQKCCQIFIKKIFDEWIYDSILDCYLWTQHFSSSYKYVGAAHGTIGNLHVLYTVKELLNKNELKTLDERATAIFERLASESNDYANWPVFADSSNKFLLHWCHGAPGVICALADHLPSGQTIDKLFIKAAELIWEAGPLKKGTSICHGTSGNAIAFLKIYKRTKDEKWFLRAKAFAMHCLEQCTELEKKYGHLRFSLWTGDLGLVWLNEQIKNNTADLPMLDNY